MKQALLIYIPCKDNNEAESISKHLLEQKLAVCTNIIDTITSLYVWPPEEKKICKNNETLLLVKTLDSKWFELEKEVLRLHSYDTPLISAIPITYISKQYYNWMKKELL